MIERLLLVVSGLLLGLAGAEILVRQTGNDPLDSLPVAPADGWQTECARLADGYGYELLPGACSANSHGFVDRERTLDRIPGERRVVALGDSLTHDSAWTWFAEGMWAARGAGQVEVFNLGVSGYGTHNERALLEARGDEFSPDAVVLQFCLNDYLRSPVFIRVDGALLRVEDYRGVLRSTGTLVAHSALLRMFLWRGAATASQRVPFSERADAGDEALLAIAAWAKERNLPFVVMVYPVLTTDRHSKYEEALTYERVLATMQAASIPYVDLTRRFVEVGLPALRLDAGGPPFAALEDTLARVGAPTSDAGIIRSAPRRALQVDLDPRRVSEDVIHPNWLGHYLAVTALTQHVATDPAWKGWLPGGSPSTP